MISSPTDIDQFVAITQATPAEAERFLSDGVTLEVSILARCPERVNSRGRRLSYI